eukprot:m.699793 g.699793  ORF g.699793 m.699793 type:complete len:52 (+) comp58693_c0_seq6:910-1065(+)
MLHTTITKYSPSSVQIVGFVGCSVRFGHSSAHQEAFVLLLPLAILLLPLDV